MDAGLKLTLSMEGGTAVVTGVDAASKSFDRLGQTGAAAAGDLDRALGKAGASTDAYTAQMNSLGQAQRAAAAGSGEVSLAAQRIMDRYDPLGTKLRAVTSDMALLRREMGNSSTDAALKSFQGLEAEIEKTQALMHKAGAAGTENFEAVAKAADKGAFATAGAKRELIVLGHEALTGNFSKMPGSFMVLAERMDLTHMLMSPVTLGIVAIGVAVIGMAVAMAKGAHTQTEMNNALILTGNFSGQTSDSLSALAHEAVKTGGSIGQANKAVIELAASGKFTGDQLGNITNAVVAMEHATGVSVDKTIKQFESLAKESTGNSERSSDAISKAVVKLDDQYHFLTLAVYDQIRALEKEGDQKAASKLATDEFAQATKDRATEIIGNLGTVARAWNAIKEGIGGAVAAVGEWGKKSTSASEVARLTGVVSGLQPGNYGGSEAFNETSRVQLLAKATSELAQAKAGLFAAGEKAAAQAQTALTQSEGIHAAQRVDAMLMGISKKSQSALTLALKEYREEINKIDAANPNDPRTTGAAIAAGEELIRKAHTEHVKSGKAVSDAENTIAASMEKANAAALLQVDTGEKLSAADKFRIASLGQIDEALRKKNITLDVAVALESRMHDIEGNISAGEAAIQQAKALADAFKEQEKATQALVNVGQKELDSLDAKIQKQREVNQQIGLTKAQTEALNSARQIQSALADEEYAQLLRNAAAYAGEYTSAYVQYANALDLAARKKRDLAGLEAQASVKLSTLDADNEREKSIKKEEDARLASVKKIGDGLYEALSNGGNSALKKLLKDFKEWFARLVLSPIINPIAEFGAGLLRTASGASGGGGLLGAAGAASNGYSLLNGAGSFGGLFASNAAYGAALGTTSVGAGSQAAMLAAQTGEFGLAGLTATYGAASGAGALSAGAVTAGSTVAAGATVATAAEVGGLVAEGYGVAATTAAGVGSAAGAAAGAGLTGALAAIPVYGWIALAALAIFGMSGGGKPTSTTGQTGIAVDPLGTIKDNGSHQYGSSAGSIAAVLNLNTAYRTTAQSLGIKPASTEFFYDGNTGKDGEHPNFALSGGVVGKGGYAIGETPVSDAAIQLAVSRAVFATLQNSELPKYLAGVFDGITAGTATQAQLATALATAQAFKGLHDQLQLLPFAELKDMSFAAAKGLADASGGLGNLAANLATFYDKYVPQAEKTATITANVGKVFASLGLAMPKLDASGRALFRSLVEGQDLTTAAGQMTRAGLLGVAGALDQLLPPLDEAAGAINGLGISAKSLAQQLKEQAGWQDKLDVLLGKTTAREISLRNDLADASNETIKSIIKQVYAQEDLKAAADAAAAAQARAAEEAQRAADGIISSWKSITDTIVDEVKRLRGEVAGTGATGYAEAQTEFAIATAKARAGDQDAAKLLPALSRNLDTLAQANAGTLLELRRMQAQTAGSLSATGSILDGLSAGQAAAAMSAGRPVTTVVGAGQAAATVVGAGAQSTGRATPQTAAKYTERYQLPTGVSAVAVTDPAAIARFNSINAAINEIGVATPEAVRRLAATAQQYGVSMFDLATASGYLYSEVRNVFAAAGVPAFAGGGDHTGGVRIVGENGPELELTGPSRIFNAPQTRALLQSGGANNDDLVRELRALRDEVKALRAEARATTGHTAKTARLLETVTEGGRAVLTEAFA